MMKMKKSILTFLFALVIMVSTMASKPVILTDFHQNYNYLEEVGMVLDRGVIDGSVTIMLSDPSMPIDEKAGIINALTVNNKYKSNALTFRQYMARIHNDNWESLNLDNLSAEELFCLGYLTIIDEGGNVENGLPILEMAEQKNPYSYTISLFRALASATASFASGNYCDGWKACQAVKANTTLNMDMDQAVSDLIFEVVADYDDGC